MSLDAESSASIGRFFAAIKSLCELDKKEIRGVVETALSLTPRESCFTLNYHRAVINIDLLLTIKETMHFQVIVMIARSVFEIAVEPLDDCRRSAGRAKD